MPHTHLVLINPPDDVTTNIQTLTQACKNWHPTEVTDVIGTIPPPPQLQVNMFGISGDPGSICQVLTSPDVMQHLVVNIVSLTVMACCAVVILIWVTNLYRLPGFLVDQACNLYRYVTHVIRHG